MVYEILALDVWGNSEDGYDINDQHVCAEVEIPEGSTDDEALKLIRDTLGHTEPSPYTYVDLIQSEYDYCFDNEETGEPCYYARHKLY